MDDRSAMGTENQPPSATAKRVERPPDEGYRAIIDLNQYLPPDVPPFNSTLPLGMPPPTEASQSAASPGHGREAVVGGRQPRPVSNDQWTLEIQEGQGRNTREADNAFRASGLMPSDVTPRASRAFETASQGGTPLIPVVK